MHLKHYSEEKLTGLTKLLKVHGTEKLEAYGRRWVKGWGLENDLLGMGHQLTQVMFLFFFFFNPRAF